MIGECIFRFADDAPDSAKKTTKADREDAPRVASVTHHHVTAKQWRPIQSALMPSRGRMLDAPRIRLDEETSRAPVSPSSGQPDVGREPVDKGGARRLGKHPCASNPCRGSGVCHVVGRRYICRCKKGRHGPNCECEQV